MPVWSDIYKLFTYAFTQNPLEKRGEKYTSAGVRSADAIPSNDADGSFWGGGRGVVRLRDTNDFLDLSTVVNRSARYKEYERLRNLPEIEMVMTCFADEACIAGNTPIPCPAYGFPTIQWLAENKKDERFLVYCFDFKKNDYSLGWGYNPRKIREEETIKIIFDDGSHFICTKDHRILLRTGLWAFAADIKVGANLMPFYRLPSNRNFNNLTSEQFPRIYTLQNGWMNERDFIDGWKNGEQDPKIEEIHKISKVLCQGNSLNKTIDLLKYDKTKIKRILAKAGFTYNELQWLGKKKDHRYVIGIEPHKKIDVYDMTVEDHHNYCTEWGVVHNCQKGENNQVFEILCKNSAVKEELEFFFFNRKMLGLNQRKMWGIVKDSCIFGDWMCEVIIDPESPKDGILDIMPLPPESIYRIETTKGKLIEFQQSKEGPDYQSLARVEVTKATDAELQQATAIRFAPEQIIHIRFGDDRKTFYPYGVSLMEAARGPAHQLRLMEDAMVIYRLIRAPERRVFYIDVGNVPSHKQEAFLDRMKDQFRKKKVSPNRSTPLGASSVEERWSMPSAEEDYWVPVRPNSNTRIETLPGAENLGEIDDTVYFRNKLFMALNFPQNYFNQTDTNQTRITLSSQDVKFARLIERIQSYVEEDFLFQLADRHLKLRGYPEEMYEDLILKMTPPSDWRELSKAEIVTGRITNVTSLKSAQLISDFDLLTKFMKYDKETAEEMIARNELQKLKDLKLQIIAQNPQLIGVGMPGQDEGDEIGTEPNGPNPMLGGQDQPQDQGQPQAPPQPGAPPQQPNAISQENTEEPQTNISFGEPSPEDIKKYDLDIEDYAKEMDDEDIDYSEE